MCHKLDPKFFSELARMDPRDVCGRSLATYDHERKVYRVTALEREYEVNPAANEVMAVDPDEGPISVEMGLLLVFYLLRAVDVPLSGKWIGEFDIKGGERFFRGPHAVRNPEVAEKFGHDPEGFGKACEKLGGTPEDMGDAAYRIRVLPRVPLIVLLWMADDEFEASAKTLMDSTVDQHLPLDIIFGMLLEVLGKIVGRVLWH